ncbi:unnamed protein product [Callosobruchus maculatus]|uniref:Uncharacterized protein n=1 Tax=Callosobruchus maculatus TaxID=64391 RepID=A0A653BKS6_CALMS|nr:unnamed protein product [Callosobruchus maculatus]
METHVIKPVKMPSSGSNHQELLPELSVLVEQEALQLEGAKCWCKMLRRKKRKYLAEACKSRRHRRRSCRRKRRRRNR